MYRLWEEKLTQTVFAVQLDAEGTVVAAQGPVERIEYPGALSGAWDPDERLTAQLAAGPESCRDITDDPSIVET